MYTKQELEEAKTELAEIFGRLTPHTTQFDATRFDIWHIKDERDGVGKFGEKEF